MKIIDLLKGINYETLQGNINKEVDTISWDSRNVGSNSLFICTRSRVLDRHSFAIEAIEKGASALVVERFIENIPSNITVIKVENGRKAMAQIANIFFNKPSNKFNLIGITGTNGKTSITYMISSILKYAGRKVGVISTIENTIDDKPLSIKKTNPTTPDSLELQAGFKEMADANVNDVVMEVTSSALDNHRVDNCDFDIGIFTNLSQDHLDEHGTMENYKIAKKKLFSLCRLGIVNMDDNVSLEFIKDCPCDFITYGINSPADISAKNMSFSITGTSFTLNFHGIEKEVKLNIPSEFNVYNALAAIAACYFLGLPLNIIIEGIAQLEGIKGRFQCVYRDNTPLAIVDYAHTPDSLEKTLDAIKRFNPRKLYVIFGCGGDRDRTKRPIMGHIAGSFANYCIITSDNPRTELPEKIIEDVEQGIKNTNCSYEKILDRKTAIIHALKMARPSDVILIAGKGHENYQILSDGIIHFDDVEVVEEFFNSCIV